MDGETATNGHTQNGVQNQKNSESEEISPEENSKFHIERKDGFTTPIRVWFASYVNKIGKIYVNKHDGSLQDNADLVHFDDVWLKLTLYITEKAEHQFTMERVDELHKVLSQENKDISYYVYMCSKMIDWLRIKAFMAGEIVCNHYGLTRETYTELRDDMNDPTLGRTFLEKSDVQQVFTLPPKYTSLSKDKSALDNSKDTLDIVSDVFTDVKEILDKYKDSISIEEHKFQMFYYFLVKDRMIMKHSVDFNDVKQAVYKLEILQDNFLPGMIEEFEEEAENMFEGRFKSI